MSRGFFKNSLFSIILVIFCYLIVEIIIGVHFYLRLNSFYAPWTLSHYLLGQNYNTQLSKTACDFGPNSWGPHPYLGFTRSLELLYKCPDSHVVNNRGMTGPDFPEAKNPDEFVIMITGGSVAEQFGTFEDAKGHQLTRYLNENFYPPRGKSFRVIVGALGDYRQPQNVIAAMLFHDVSDAIIDISGYNEAKLYHINLRLETASPVYWDQFSRLVDRALNEEILDLIKWMESGVCSSSYSCFFFVEKAVQYKARQKALSLKRFNHLALIDDYPKEWSEEQNWQHRINKHRGYYEIFNSICQSKQMLCAFFIQPIPQISKELTNAEKLHVVEISPGFKDHYLRMTQELIILRNRAVPIHSLLDIFKAEKSAVYTDEIHFIYDHGQRYYKGHELMLEAIARTVSKNWNLKRKK